MLVTKYLVVGYKKHQSSCRLAAKAPALKAHEIAIKLNLDIPNEIFLKPALEADIVIPKDSVVAGKITADILDDIQGTVKKNLGIHMHVSLIE